MDGATPAARAGSPAHPAPASPERRGVAAAEAASTVERAGPHLASRIDLLWSATPSGAPGTTLHEYFPDAGVQLVFRDSPEGCRAVLLGPTREKAAVERAGGAEYLGIRFLAGQAPRLADVRASDLVGGHVELTRIGGASVEEVAERLRALPDAAARRRALAERVARADGALVEDARCRRGAFLVEARRGRIRVEELAAELGLEVRTLERRFLAQLGLTPKRLIRLVRLRHVLGALHAGTFSSLAELAQACGYSDQPHLVRDFKALTGRTPGVADASRGRVLARSETGVVHRYRP